MKADEMFEELGYRMYGNNDYIMYMKFIDENLRKRYDFDLENKEVMIGYDTSKFYNISIKEHKAIHHKMKELGWLE